MKLVTAADITPGLVMYYARCLGNYNQRWIDKQEVTSDIWPSPCQSIEGSPFVDIHCNDYDTRISLEDSGIVPTYYNDHLTFFTRADAEEYIQDHIRNGKFAKLKLYAEQYGICIWHRLPNRYGFIGKVVKCCEARATRYPNAGMGAMSLCYLATLVTTIFMVN